MQLPTLTLNDRELRADGAIGANAEHIEQLLLRGIDLSSIYFTTESEDISKFNMLSDIKLKHFDNEADALDFGWNIPAEFKAINLDKFVNDLIETLPAKYRDVGEIRLQNELQEFKRRNLVEFLKTIIFIVSTFKKQNIIWGVGRGSSCASYLLYKIGLHSVDCLKFNIPYTEFFHD